MTDTGLARHFGVVDRWETLVRQNRAGAMVETWVATELRLWENQGFLQR